MATIQFAAAEVAAAIRASAIRDQFVAATDDRAVVAFLLQDKALLERLLRIARLADPEPHWRDRFRDPAVWQNEPKLVPDAPILLASNQRVWLRRP